MKTRIIIFLLLWIGFSGCQVLQLNLRYDPQTTEEISGSIKVADFGYFPEEGIEQNEIRRTAIFRGRIFITDDVGIYFANATKREFRQSGISLKGNCKLEGEVNEFSIDMGYSSDYSTDVRYILYDESGKVLLDNNYTVKLTMLIGDIPEGLPLVLFFSDNFNKAVSDNIKQLMTDPAFLTSVENNC